MSGAGNVTLVPQDRDILDSAAAIIIAGCDSLPDLSRTVVLLPDLQFASQLRQRLLDAAMAMGHDALLGPQVTTPGLWLQENTWLDQETPARARRELLLVEVLQQHPDVFGHDDPWRIAASLVTLFEEMTLHRVPVPASAEAFIERLRSAYGIEDRLPEPLGQEGGIVHRLWTAWHEQLQADDMADPGAAHLQRLALATQAASDLHFCLLGFDSPPVADAEWFCRLLDSGKASGIFYRGDPGNGLLAERLQRLEQEKPASPSAAEHCLDILYTRTDEPLVERAARLSSCLEHSPLAGQLSVFAARSPESEARAIDLQVRQWLLDGKTSIGIVTEDRRLARRVRALLERAGITPRDMGGWALSTTSAAAALERWLETVEEDFAYQPLLDVLKSPFSFPGDDAEALAADIYRFEQDIVHHENIARGLERYRKHIRLRAQRLKQAWSERTAARLQQLLNQLDHAADPLRPFLDTTAHAPDRILDALKASLEELGMWQTFSNDPAGQRILGEWQLLHHAASQSQVTMNWPEFRAWLGSALESHDFTPATADSPVMLLTLQQAQPGYFDGVIIGACDLEHLPVRNPPSAFFNDAVRTDLGLPVWPDQYTLQLLRFRRLLQRAPQVLMTWHSEAGGEQRMPGPWVAALQNFHRLAWGSDLENTRLQPLLDEPGTQVRGNHPLPEATASRRPAPALPPGFLPGTISVSSHDDLVACPYRFFAARGLGLKPREAISEALEKAGYGELVHRCLEIFHAGKEGYPPAFTEPVTPANRDAAARSLETISRAVFTRELEDNFEHRAWLARWLERIPAYIRWQEARQPEWRFSLAEQALEMALGNGHTLHGRIDRIDTNGSDLAITDYKTGAIPKQAEVEAGEKVQLSTYALLTKNLPARVDYLDLDDGQRKVKPGPALASEALAELATAVGERLVAVLDAIEAGSPMPAWGNADACRYCSMDVVCRQQAWPDTGEEPGA